MLFWRVTPTAEKRSEERKWVNSLRSLSSPKAPEQQFFSFGYPGEPQKRTVTFWGSSGGPEVPKSELSSGGQFGSKTNLNIRLQPPEEMVLEGGKRTSYGSSFQRKVSITPHHRCMVFERSGLCIWCGVVKRDFVTRWRHTWSNFIRRASRGNRELDDRASILVP